MGAGPAFVEKFGHTALCVRYPAERQRDACYNYGTTNFAAPVQLVTGFLRGNSVFWVSVNRPASMMSFYRRRDRTVWRQVLPLSPRNAEALAQRLAHDAQPEYRDYQYHHYRDNCSTRVRDMIDEFTGRALSGTRSTPGRLSFREHSRRGYADNLPLLLALDVVLGRPVDEVPSQFDEMFLPLALRDAVQQRLGVAPEVIYHRRGSQFSTDPGWARGWFLYLALLLAAPLALARWRRRRERLALVITCAPLALLGAILWLVALVSPLPELRYNEVLLIFLPGDALLPWLRPPWRQRYLHGRIAGLFAVSLLAAVGVLVQPLWTLLLVPLLPFAVAAWPPRPGRTIQA